MKASLRAALPGAAALAAQVIMGKALRDALFLARWPATALPMALAVSAVAAAGAALGLSRALGTREPRRLAPIAWVASALLLGVEALWSEGGSRLSAFVIYVHLSAVAGGLGSLFWIQMGEAFDPRSARAAFAWTSALGTAGAIAASFAAGPLAKWGGYGALLGTVALLQIACAAAAPAIRPLSRTAESPREPGGDAVEGGVEAILRHPYLLQIALLVIALSVATTLLDYVFKARVAAHFPAAQRVEVFAAFYAGTSALAFLAQIALTRRMLGHLGLARTVALMPAALGAATAALFAFPGFALTVIARGVEATLRGSVYRAGYELLFTPLSSTDRRSTKTVLDVGADRAGDGLGALVLAIALGVAGLAAERTILAISAVTALAASLVALALHRGYVDALERGLARGKLDVDPAAAEERTTRETLITTLGGTRGLDAAAIRAEFARRSEQAADAREADLLSDDAERIHAALGGGPIPPALAALVIRLLGRDDVAADALHALRGSADELLPALEAALRDPATPIAVRRRLPRAITRSDSPQAWNALLAGLDDPRFDVRIQCALALDRWRESHPGHRIDTEQLFDLVVRELRRDHEVWEARRRIAAGHPTLFDQAVRQRSDRSFSLVFTLLSLALPPEPMRLAHRGLLSPDPRLRGTALEYLESVLPPRVRDGLWPYLEERPGTRPRVSSEVALENLVRANPSVAIALADLAALAREDEAKERP